MSQNIRAWQESKSEKSELDLHFLKHTGRVVLRGDVVKDESTSYAVFTEWEIFHVAHDRRQNCSGRHFSDSQDASDSISLHQLENGRRTKVIEIAGIGMSNNFDSTTTITLPNIVGHS